MRQEVNIVIDDDDLTSSAYYHEDDPLDQMTRTRLVQEFRTIMQEREVDLETIKRERGKLTFDPENLDLEGINNGEK
jgi:hypothetical protein